MDRKPYIIGINFETNIISVLQGVCWEYWSNDIINVSNME